ncbi:MAG: hypothetical protein CVV27_02420 [Candidatus Melainabacteria bacterium HGW-Melainabacteria-1]|nr:MAG: hypothetical protein CVV27_02420 [Candidatus Melainabacteria bacterium HGW-Melainabacteria-1]
MRQTLAANSSFGLIGTWRGVEFPDMPAHLRNQDILDLLALVRAQIPAYDQTPALRQMQGQGRNQLLRQTYLSFAQIDELILFEGTAKAFKPLLEQALADANLVPTNPEARAAVRAILSEQLEILRSARVQRQWDLLKDGALGFKGVVAWHQHNKILNAYTTTLSKIMRGIGGVNDTLEVQACVVGAGYSVPASDQTALDHQLGSSKAPSDSVYTGYQTTFLTSFLPADNNGLETTVTAASSPSSVTLDDTTGLSVGDRLHFNGAGLAAGGEFRTIATLPGSDVVTLTEALSITPPVSTVVIQGWGETGLLINGDSVLGTRSRVSDGGYAKSDTKGNFVESAVTARIVGS